MARVRIALLAAMSAVFATAAAAQPASQTAPAAVTANHIELKQVTLPPRTVVYTTGHADFDNVYEGLVAALKRLREFLDKEGIASTGPAIARYTDGDENGFEFQAAYPVARAPSNLPQGDIAVGEAPSGKALEFVHRGSFDSIDETYSAIDNYFREGRGASATGSDAEDALGGSFEEYTTDPLTTGPEKVEVHILVPVK